MSAIYFIRPVGQLGPIKIGFSRWPHDRLKTYATWSPVPLEIVATIPGNHTLERRLHHRFAADRSHHEWFHATGALLAIIETARNGTFCADGLPEPRAHWRGRRMPAAATRAGLMCRRLGRLRKGGIPIPPEVEKASHTYRCTPDETARRRAIVEQFVLAHSERSAA
jgi:hypothetical protein